MEIVRNTGSIGRAPLQKEPGYIVGTFTEAMQKTDSGELSAEVSGLAPIRSAINWIRENT
jgi:hypothetical protein